MDARAVRGLDRFSAVRPRDRADGDGRRRARARAWAGRPTASGSGSTSGRRWAASPSRRAQHEKYLGARPASRSPPPSRSRSSAAPRRPTSASRSTSAGRSCRPPTRARRGRSRSARRSARSATGEIDAGDRRRRRVPAVAARVRRLRPHPGPRVTATTTTRRTPSRPMDAGRDGFVMGEGAGAARAGGRRGRARRRGARAVRRGPRLRRDVRRPPHGPAACRRPRGGPRDHASRSPTPAVAADEIDWVSAHASSTPIGDIAEARAIAAGLGDRAATVPVSATKGLTGHPLGATGRDRGRDGRARLPRRLGARDGEPRGARAGPRRAPAGPPARRPGRHATAGSCRPRSASAASTRRWSSGPSTGDDPRVSRARYPRAMTDMPTWERRFRAPILAFPSWAADAPDRLVMASTESGSYQLHTWDRATGERRQVTEDPVGVLEGRPTRDGTGVIWFHDETGAESGSYVIARVRRADRGRAADRGTARRAGPRAWRSARRARSPASAPTRVSRSGRRSTAASRGGSTSTRSRCGSPAAGA